MTTAPAAEATGDVSHAALPVNPTAGPTVGQTSGQTAGSSAQKEISLGDWVAICGSANKVKDREVIGQEGVVTRMEPNGWVELQVPRLGHAWRIQQRWLSPVPGCGTAATGSSGKMPRSASLADCYDETVRPPKRVHLETPLPPLPPLRSTTPAEKLLPSKIGDGTGPQPSPFDLRLPDLSLRKLVRDLMSLEEWLPWSAVEAVWRAKRPTWRKSLRHLEQTKAYDGHVPSMAAAVHELYNALQADKGAGFFSRAGPWETRLLELSHGGDNHLCLVQLWVELQDAVRNWQQANGAPQWPIGGSSNAQPAGGTSHSNPGQLGVAGGHIAYRAFAALEAASERGEARLKEVPLEEILCHSTVHLAALRAIVERERHYVAACLSDLAAAEALRLAAEAAAGSAASGVEGVASAATAAGGTGRDAAVGGSDLAAVGPHSGGTAGVAGQGATAAAAAAAAGTSDGGDGVGLIASLADQMARSGSVLSPGLRSELQLMRAAESEVDTDLDFGSDGSDVQ